MASSYVFWSEMAPINVWLEGLSHSILCLVLTTEPFYLFVWLENKNGDLFLVTYFSLLVSLPPVLNHNPRINNKIIVYITITHISQLHI